ncbi:hypothetical protein [Pseudonocardia acaciae]|uniref:hypothetical protein n=1 Tax=Pseudonocardia acaciae TaxID=551276 RepID=UPI00048DD9BB|nr:hypothetical protein [Pseudonocardia acaciae]
MKVRRLLLFAVMLGALSLSFHGQVASVAPQLGVPFAVVFAISYDVATLLALHEAMTPGVSGRVRRWAWTVLIQAGGTALGLNTWYGLSTGMLPSPVAVAVGAGPVMLAWSLSHLFALVLAERTGRTGSTGDGAASRTASADSHPSPREQQPGPVLDAPAARALPAPECPGGVDGPVPVAASRGASDEDALVDRAERLERQARAASGGKQGISYRAAAKRLRVRYGTARAALDAARSRLDADAAPETPRTGGATAA